MQRGALRLVVGEGDLVERDHVETPERSGWTGSPAAARRSCSRFCRFGRAVRRRRGRGDRVRCGDGRDQGNQDPHDRQQGNAGKRQRGERDGESRHIEGTGNRHGDECDESRAGHDPLGLSPRVRAVARTRRTAPPHGQTDPAEHGGDGENGEAQSEERPSVDHAVDPDRHQQQSADGGSTGQPARRLPEGDPSSVASGVHAGRQLERAVQCALQHRNGDTPHAAQPLGRNAALAARLTHDPDGLHQLRGERQRHRDRHAGLVQHRGERPEQPVRTGERVRRAEAEQNHRELQPENKGIEDGLQRHRTADAHGDRP